MGELAPGEEGEEVKFCSPAFATESGRPRGAIEIDAGDGRRYDFRKGIQDVSPQAAKEIVAAGGFLPSMSGTTRKQVGFRCQSCGFGTFFSACSRCGGHAVKEH